MLKMINFALGLVIVSAVAANAADLKSNAETAGKLLAANGIDGGVAEIKKAGTELVNLEGDHGLHLFAFDSKGINLFDLSGQTKAGADMSSYTMADGTNDVKRIMAGVKAGNGGAGFHYENEIPNPATNVVAPADSYCVEFEPGKIVCAMQWTQ